MEETIRDNGGVDKIKIFTADEEKLKMLGELLSNRSSRNIIKLLIEKEMYTNEIAKKLELRVSLVLHHLQKMEVIGLLEITNKQIIKNGEEHRFFRIPARILLMPNTGNEEIVRDRFLIKFFKSATKFAIIGLAAFTSWIVSESDNTIRTGSSSSEIDPLLIPLLIIVVGLITERIVSSLKKIKNDGLS